MTFHLSDTNESKLYLLYDKKIKQTFRCLDNLLMLFFAGQEVSGILAALFNYTDVGWLMLLLVRARLIIKLAN